MATVDRDSSSFTDFSLPSWALQLWPEAAAHLREPVRNEPAARQRTERAPKTRRAARSRKAA